MSTSRRNTFGDAMETLGSWSRLIRRLENINAGCRGENGYHPQLHGWSLVDLQEQDFVNTGMMTFFLSRGGKASQGREQNFLLCVWRVAIQRIQVCHQLYEEADLCPRLVCPTRRSCPKRNQENPTKIIEEWLQDRESSRSVRVLKERTLPERGSWVETGRRREEEPTKGSLDKDQEISGIRRRKRREPSEQISWSEEWLVTMWESKRMEAYDILITQCFEIYGSKAVCLWEKKESQRISKFKIKSVQKPNDYATKIMEEVLTRRLLLMRKEWVWQLFHYADRSWWMEEGYEYCALKVLENLGMIWVCGMV